MHKAVDTVKWWSELQNGEVSKVWDHFKLKLDKNSVQCKTEKAYYNSTISMHTFKHTLELWYLDVSSLKITYNIANLFAVLKGCRKLADPSHCNQCTIKCSFYETFLIFSFVLLLKKAKIFLTRLIVGIICKCLVRSVYLITEKNH